MRGMLLVAAGGLACLIGAGTSQADARTVVQCSAALSSVTISDTEGSITSAPTFKRIKGAITKVRVPAGKSRCIKIRLAIEMSCSSTKPAPEYCVVRAIDNGTEIDPVDDIVFSDDESVGVRSFNWTKRVGAGTHTIEIQFRAFEVGTSFLVDSYTLDVEVTK